MSENVTRRTFLEHSAAGSAALGLSFATTAYAAQDAPGRKVVVGVMGLSRGMGLAQTFAKTPGVEVRYLCDIDAQRVGKGVEALSKASGQSHLGVGDYRKILDDKQVDALVCAAPNHWHAPATIVGCSAGKHVYVEKPCCHNPQEGEWMVAAARKNQKAVQMGTQRRSSPATIAAMQELRDGVIGRVYCARAWYASARGPIGIGKPAEVPKHLDYNYWQGPAPRVPYLDNRVHYNWHWFWHWGNGELGNNGIHTLDLCRWGLGVDYPIHAVSSGGRYRFEDDQETPDTHTVTFEFANRSSICWQGLSCNKNVNDFVKFYGEKGSLSLDERGGYVIYDDNNKESKKVPGTGNGEADHVANFIAAIRDDQPLRLNQEILSGHKSTLLCHLGNIAHRTGRTLKCNPEDGHILNDDAAMKLWRREYEPGWEPKV
ncbi:MAG: Gfo/Idh/MocA family oxidoreductase [Planctomycetales bacterium]|nr:Gfo/Idh/MocA family oxidoreductase [Planctomycetales bacterium]